MREEFSQLLDTAWEETLPGNGPLSLDLIQEMLSCVGISLPSYRVRHITDQLAEKEEFEDKQKELEEMWGPLSRKIYGQKGEGRPAASSDGPTVEEVD